MRVLRIVIIAMLLLASISCAGQLSDSGSNPAPPAGSPALTLPQSLHGTASGMKWWYERPGGLGSLINVDYEATHCGSCHASKCEDCHGPTGTAAPSQPETCRGCHGRQDAEFKMGTTDVHFTAGFKCSDCHSMADIHGDGTQYDSMLEAGALDAKCETCHINGTAPTPPNDINHTQHGDKLSCDACHVKTVTTCYNCHFNSLLDDHVKRPYKPIQNFVILMNDKDGKVRTGTYQSVVRDNTTFIAFGPFHGHSVMAQGRVCGNCHNSERMVELRDTGKIVMTTWDATVNPDTEKPIGIVHASGVIPFVPDKFEFQHLSFDKGTGNWSPLKNTSDRLQWEFCSPLTAEQLAALGAE